MPVTGKTAALARMAERLAQRRLVGFVAAPMGDAASRGSLQKSGAAKEGQSKAGVVKNGVVKNGLVKFGQAKVGQAKVGNIKQGLTRVATGR